MLLDDDSNQNLVELGFKDGHPLLIESKITCIVPNTMCVWMAGWLSSKSLRYTYTVKPETLASGNFDEFGKLGSNCQTLTFQSKATKQNKCFSTYKRATVQSKISTFANISPKFLSPKFLESGFTKV